MRKDLVYVGTYTRSGKCEGIYVYRRDQETGALEHLHTTPEVDPSFLAFSPDQRYLFAVSETQQYEGKESGSVVSFQVDQESGKLSFINRQATLGGDPCHLVTDPTGRFLIVANHEAGNVSVFPIQPDGSLKPASDLKQHEGSGPGPSQKGPHAHFAAVDPTGKFILVNDKGIDKVMIYRLDATSGKLVPHDPPFARLHPGAAPRHLAFHPNGRYVYVIGEADLTITAFDYDGERGVLTEIHHVPTIPAGATGQRMSTAQVLIEPSGRFIYVSNRGHDSIAIFEIDQATGRLSPVGHEPTQGRTPRNFAFDPEARFLYAANQNSDTIVQFAVDRQNGLLSATGRVTQVGAPVCILFS